MADPYRQQYNQQYQYTNYNQTPEQSQQADYDSRQPAPGYAPPPTEGPNYRWFVPSEGIRRDVIQADLQRYLGNDAVMKVGYGTDNRTPGYWIAAYRNLTSAMIADLKNDSANFERTGARGKYEDSMIHRSRQYYGPTSPDSGSSAPTPASHGSSRQPQYQDAYSQPGYTSSANPSYPPRAGGPGPQPPPVGQSASPFSTSSGPPSASPASTYSSSNSNYTYSTNPQTGAPSASYPAGTAPGYNVSYSSSDPNAVPRGHSHPHASYPNQQQAHSFSHQQQSIPPASATAPPGYYLASDGRYYPNDTRST